MTLEQALEARKIMKDRDHWGWRQSLSWKIGFRRAKAGHAYSCPWWADERVYGLAFMQGKGLEIPKRPDPFKYERHLRDEGKGGY